jgi:hypothetical protein
MASISKCTTSLSEGNNTGFIGIFKDLNSKRVGKLSLDYSYLNSIGVTSMIATVGVDPLGKVLIATLIKTNIELSESQKKRILKNVLKLEMLPNKDASCIEFQQVRLAGVYLFGPSQTQ